MASRLPFRISPCSSPHRHSHHNPLSGLDHHYHHSHCNHHHHCSMSTRISSSSSTTTTLGNGNQKSKPKRNHKLRCHSCRPKDHRRRCHQGLRDTRHSNCLSTSSRNKFHTTCCTSPNSSSNSSSESKNQSRNSSKTCRSRGDGHSRWSESQSICHSSNCISICQGKRLLSHESLQLSRHIQHAHNNPNSHGAHRLVNLHGSPHILHRSIC
mmetsp:Transcript_28181/g.80837  ORF Transcript_28181/g.80837 Transcript_28181/m.80837 type:complete len:211 (-) Transcript_28181:551-1183(-)